MPRKKPAITAGVRSNRGKPPFKPTREQRKMVEAMAGFGISQEEIAACIGDGISVTTLVKYFRQELNTATAKMVAQVGAGLFQAALKARTDPRYQTSAIFFLKTRGRWSQPKQTLKIEGNDKAAELRIVISPDDERL